MERKMKQKIKALLESRDSVTEQSGKEFKQKVLASTNRYKELVGALCEILIEMDDDLTDTNKRYQRLLNKK